MQPRSYPDESWYGIASSITSRLLWFASNQPYGKSKNQQAIQQPIVSVCLHNPPTKREKKNKTKFQKNPPPHISPNKRPRKLDYLSLAPNAKEETK